MENQSKLFKGELMEELLRNYFLNSGYYVVRGVKYRYENNDITDVDLYLYGRTSSISRQRVNVDIKNKKTPQAFERILWANGLMRLLNFDSCIVATTDRRSVIHTFGQLHSTTILDGVFLSKLKSDPLTERLTEEDLLRELAQYKSYQTFGNKDWRFLYDVSKSKLLTEQDFSGFNSTLSLLSYFLEKIMTDDHKRVTATRMLYIILSHLLIMIDYIVKDIVFLEQADKEKRLSDGFKFGNLGKEGVDKIVSMAVQISGNKSASSFLRSLDDIPTEILKDFFSKNENTKSLFLWAKSFENLGFKKNFEKPEDIEAPLKGVISVILDFNKLDRKKYFDSYSKMPIKTVNLEKTKEDVDDKRHRL